MKIYDEKQFIGLENLNNAYKMNKKTTHIVLYIVPLIVLIFITGFIVMYVNSKETVYVLTRDGVSVLERTVVRENREFEAVRHIALFYERFLDLDPSHESISQSLEETYFLGGDVIKELAKVYHESGYYNKLIAQNIIMRHEINDIDIHVNTDSYPFTVVASGKQILIRKTNREERSFNITCSLYNMNDRTRLNPHAFWIEDLRVIENKKIE